MNIELQSGPFFDGIIDPGFGEFVCVEMHKRILYGRIVEQHTMRYAKDIEQIENRIHSIQILGKLHFKLGTQHCPLPFNNRRIETERRFCENSLH